MDKIQPFYNHGRWLARCPLCAQPSQVRLGNEFLLCGNCWPDKYKKRIQRIPTGDTTVSVDQKALRRAKSLAAAANEIYKLEWHKQAKEIEDELRWRKKPHQAWLSKQEADLKKMKSQTLKQLQAETKVLPELAYAQAAKDKQKDKDPTLPEVEVVIPDIDPDFARRIT